MFVNITSDKCYDNRGANIPFGESDRLGGEDPYSVSKACVEMLHASIFNAKLCYMDSGIRAATVRAGNVIGGGDWSSARIIPDIFRSIKSGSTLKIRNPDATRPWQHVLECNNFYLALAERLGSPDGKNYEGSWNFAGDNKCEISVEQLVEFVLDALPPNYRFNFRIDENRGLESIRLKLNTSKTDAAFPQLQRLDVGNAIRMTIDWYVAELEGRDIRLFSEGQLFE